MVPEEVEVLYGTYQFDFSPQAVSGDASPVSLQWFLLGLGISDLILVTS